MTLDEFDAYMDTSDGQTHFYEWLYDNFPELGKQGLFSAMENGDHIDGFMDYMGVSDEPATTTDT